MKTELKILMQEHNDGDAERIKTELRKGGYPVRVHRVKHQKDFLEVTTRELPDLILSDHGLPDVNGFELFAMARQKCPQVPFVFVTGLHGTERDIETMTRAGLDYILKNRLSGLVPVVQRVLNKAQRSYAFREQTSNRRHELTHRLLDGIPDYAICQMDGTGRLISWNAVAREIMGFSAEEILGRNFSCFYPPEDVADDRPSRALTQAASAGRFREETVWRRKNGATYWADLLIAPLPAMPETVSGFALVVQDVTARKERENEREQMARGLESTLNEIKILSGIVPICASCKKVRDYLGQWHPLEIYLRDHSEATLIHEFCGDCSQLIQARENHALPIPAVAGV